MAQIIFQPSICSEVPTRPNVLGCDDASRVKWDVLEKPVGSAISIDDDTLVEPVFDASQDGEYRLQLCCYFESGEVNAETGVEPPQLNCPRGVIAGQTATVYLTGCEDGTAQNAVAAGVATGVTFNSQGVGTVTTSATSPGLAYVAIDCVSFDENGVQTSEELFCEFEVIPANTQLVCTTAPALSVSYEACGESCECTEVTAVFDCAATECDSAQIGLVFRDCPECAPVEDCEELELQFLTGSRLASLSNCSDSLSCCDEDYCCEPDMPALFWNNLCTCPDWTMEAPAIEGSSVYNVCSCNPGQQWCFEGSATIVLSGPQRVVDTLIIWGHNLTDGTVTVSPLTTIDGNSVSVGVIDDGACIGGYTTPVVMNFTDPAEPEGQPQVNDLLVTDLTVTITSNTGGIVCIDQLFLGQKVFFPDDGMPETFQNPHDGTDYELEVKSSSCGPLSRSLKHVPVDLSVEIDCVDDRWLKEVWRPYLRYAEKHGVLFQHSRNNCPNDVFNGTLKGPVGPSSYNSLNRYTVTLEAEGYVTQDQPKLLA